MILVFAGAGASKAVNQSAYPTTIEFFQKLSDQIKNNPIFRNIEGYLRNGRSKEDPIDIEEIIWTIYELEDFASAITGKGNLIGWFLNDRKLLESMGAKYDVNPLMDVSRALVEKAYMLSRQIDEQVYDFYSAAPEKEELEQNWLPLLKLLLKKNMPLEIFTTNYDVVIETAIDILSRTESLPKINTGRINSVQPHLNLDIWEKPQDNRYEGEYSGGLLTKLHGSIDWSRRQNNIYVGTPLYTGDPAKHVILYPGYKGGYNPRGSTAKKLDISFGPPIGNFLEHFARVIEMSEIFIFIGFAFRDDHINDLLTKRMSPNASIFIINPNQNLSNPTFPTRNITHIQKGFDNDAITALMENL